jgi:hypothetical protein
LAVALAGSRKFLLLLLLLLPLLFLLYLFIIHHVYHIPYFTWFLNFPFLSQSKHEIEVYVSDLFWDLHFHRSGIMLRCFILEIIISKTRGNDLASQHLQLL